MGVSEAFSKFCSLFHDFYTHGFTEKGEQNTKNASETPNVIIYLGRKAGIEGPSGVQKNRKDKITPKPLVRERSLEPTELSTLLARLAV